MYTSSFYSCDICEKEIPNFSITHGFKGATYWKRFFTKVIVKIGVGTEIKYFDYDSPYHICDDCNKIFLETCKEKLKERKK